MRPDLVLGPLLRNPDTPANAVTPCWLERCTEDVRLYDPEGHLMFQPLTVPSSSPIADKVGALGRKGLRSRARPSRVRTTTLRPFRLWVFDTLATSQT